MLVRGTRRLASGFAIALVVLTIFMVYYGPNLGSDAPSYHQGGSNKLPSDPGAPITPPGGVTPGTGKEEQESSLAGKPIEPVGPGEVKQPDAGAGLGVLPEQTSIKAKTPTTSSVYQRATKPGGVTTFVKDTHRELSSLTTTGGAYFDVDFSPWPAYNPNFTPHPTKNDTWITVAQYHKTEGDNQVWFTQVICEAKFVGNSLKCTHPPWIVPIPPTWSDKCEGEISHFNFNIGPHDARVFFGPERPYILYGTQSSYSCFGQWFQDFTIVSDWPGTRAGKFRAPTEIHRPPPFKYSQVEKNWFLFWDMDGELYVHHDIYPKRVFGKMNEDGRIEKDAVQIIADEEEKCLNKLVPYAKPTYEESVHQATNSLAITMCKRSDPSCIPSASNTFVFHIFHWKSFYEFHGIYEPYVHMFSQAAPFATYGISSKPLWFRGRRLPGTWREEGKNGWNQTEMVYTTSIAWKDHGMKYNGYLDDTLLLGFGIEDKECGGLDIVAADLFRDITTCDGSPIKISV